MSEGRAGICENPQRSPFVSVLGMPTVEVTSTIDLINSSP
ncbi:hypothetical protein APV28_3167 [Comamonas testosteroni]|nr:hypothetical protein APV28_3167 [Comamonas testosteroni]